MNKSEREARNLLASIGVLGPPILVDDIAAQLGVQLSREPVSPHISGLLFRDEQRCIIGLNARNSRQRQRFTIAHELGHFLLHEGELILDTSARMNWRDDTSSLATEAQEIQANAFAAELLMPESMVRRSWEKLSIQGRRAAEPLIRELAAEYDVSLQAMQYRLMNLSLLMPA